ncbi:thiol reductant ABC exporter subunit CydC [Xanthobacter sediminis]
MKDFVRLLALMRPQALWMGLAVLLSAFASLAHMALLALSGGFITASALAGAAGAAVGMFAPAAAGLAMARTLGRYVERIVGHEATLKFVARLRPWFFTRLTPLAPAALEDQRSGDLLARLKGDIDRLEFAFLRVVSPVLAAVLVLAAGLAFIAAHDPAMALAVAVAAALSGLGLPALVQRLAAPAARAVTAHGAELDASLVDHLEGRAELDIYDPGRRHRAKVEATSNTLIAAEGRLAGIAGFSGAGVSLAAQASLLMVILIGAPRVLGGSLPGPDLTMLALLALALFEGVAPLPLAFRTLPATLASARRIFALVDRPAPVADPAAPLPAPAEGTLAFDHAGLTYPGADRPAVADVSLTLEPGRRIGIVGQSGSGKSSLVALALRFRAPTAGDVSFAGASVSAYDADALRARLSVLAQGDHLFSATIRENLMIAAPEAGETALKAACAKAGILAFIEAQPDGFDTFVGAHGAKVSGGEARRLGLARALLKDAPILILDEPTEGLDTQTERRVMAAVLDATEGRALLLVSHRRARLDAMDEIIVMADGRITARGTPAAILKGLDGPACAPGA